MKKLSESEIPFKEGSHSLKKLVHVHLLGSIE